VSGGFASRLLEVDGVSVRSIDCGTGDIAVVLHDETGSAPTAFEETLAERFRVVALESTGFAALAPEDGARLLARTLQALGIEKYAVIASEATTATALFHAAQATADALVLLSPAGPLASAEAHLSKIKAPTLVLVGTKDNSVGEPATPPFADRISECYPMLVYDCGPDMMVERPAALFEAVADFLERRGRFILERQTSIISP